MRGKYRDVILPMIVIRRLDSLLEPTKEAVLDNRRSRILSRHRFPTIKSALGFAHAAIALPAHLIMLTPPSILDLPGSFTRPGRRKGRGIEFLRPTMAGRFTLSTLIYAHPVRRVLVALQLAAEPPPGPAVPAA